MVFIYFSKLTSASIVSADSGGGYSQERSQSINGFGSNQSHVHLAGFSLISGNVVGIFTENWSVQVRSDDVSEGRGFQQISNLGQKFFTLSASHILKINRFNKMFEIPWPVSEFLQFFSDLISIMSDLRFDGSISRSDAFYAGFFEWI